MQEKEKVKVVNEEKCNEEDCNNPALVKCIENKKNYCHTHAVLLNVNGAGLEDDFYHFKFLNPEFCKICNKEIVKFKSYIYCGKCDKVLCNKCYFNSKKHECW